MSFFTNDDFLDDLDFGGPQSFNYLRKDKPEELDIDEYKKNQIVLQYAPVEKPLLFFNDLKKNTITKKTKFKLLMIANYLLLILFYLHSHIL